VSVKLEDLFRGLVGKKFSLALLIGNSADKQNSLQILAGKFKNLLKL
jgi:hypothetical protein